MLEQSFHTPLPLELEVGIPSGDIEVETTEGEESNITVDGDDRLLEEVEIRHDGNRLVVAYRGKGKFGFSLSPLSLVFGSELRVRATVPQGAEIKVKTALVDTRLDGHFGQVGVNSVSGDLRVRGEIAGNASSRPSAATRTSTASPGTCRRTRSRATFGSGRSQAPPRRRPSRATSASSRSPRATSASRACPATSRSASPMAQPSTSMRARPRATSPRRSRSAASPYRARATRLRPSSSAVAPSAAT